MIVHWNSLVEAFETQEYEVLKNYIGLETILAKMKIVAHSRSYKLMMQKISQQYQMYQVVGERLSQRNQEEQEEIH